MFRKLGVFAILMTSLMSASAPAFTNTVVTDDELVTALRTLAKKNYSTTFARESANSWRIRTLLVSTAGIVGGSAAALLRYGKHRKSSRNSPTSRITYFGGRKPGSTSTASKSPKV